MNKVKAWCVKGSHPDDLKLWTCSFLKLKTIRVFTDFSQFNNWDDALKSGYEVIEITIGYNQ